MNINDFVKANAVALYLGTNASQQTANSGSAGKTGLAAQPGFQKAEKRIQAQVDVATAQLSSFGKLKSALSDVQTAGQGLAALPGGGGSTGKPAAQKAALGQFVAAYNAAIDSAKAAASVTGDGAATQSALRTIKDLLHAVNAKNGSQSVLGQLGLDLGANGKLVLDANAFEAAQKADPAAVAQGLGALGQQVAATSTQELAMDGHLGLYLSSLAQRTSILKSQQGMLASLGLYSSTSQASSTGGAYDFGLAAYRKSLQSGV
ncbi:MAG: flagellar filament capping protein FliD [Burkholderiales bacterium]|nr:flagellar filament capping protein FliD [Burkholderiales bacterium]